MANYTIPLKDVIKFKGEENLGLNAYPIFDESYRDALNRKIIRHYWNNEIGHETPEIFVFELENKMNEIMPLYNQHYVLSLLEVDPLSTVSMKSITAMDSTATNTGNSASDSTSGAKSRAVASTTPQNQLSGEKDYADALQDNVSDTTATSEATETSEAVQTGTNDNTLTGYQGHAPELILRARQALVNVDMLVIAELKELFMLLWNTSDDYTRSNNPYFYGGYGYGIY